MIKLFLYLVAIHQVLCAAGIPFVEYGLPSESNLEQQSLPSINQQSIVPEVTENLPGTKNLIEKNQLPLNLPGTRNLDEKSIPDSVTRNIPSELPGTINLAEKSIPDSVTLRKIPNLPKDLEVPRYFYQGGFVLREEKNEETPYPLAEKSDVIQQELPYDYPTPVVPFYPYPPTDETSGSDKKETELFPSSNSPQVSLGTFPPSPEQINGGENILSSSIVPFPGSGVNPGESESINVPPVSSINVQDGHGQYSHGFANPDGTQVQESGHLISTDDGWEYVIAKEGSYRYFSPEGIPISVRYIADENGFRIISQSFGSR